VVDQKSSASKKVALQTKKSSLDSLFHFERAAHVVGVILKGPFFERVSRLRVFPFCFLFFSFAQILCEAGRFRKK
jgi:hypothetical protein